MATTLRESRSLSLSCSRSRNFMNINGDTLEQIFVDCDSLSGGFRYEELMKPIDAQWGEINRYWWAFRWVIQLYISILFIKPRAGGAPEIERYYSERFVCMSSFSSNSFLLFKSSLAYLLNQCGRSNQPANHRVKHANVCVRMRTLWFASFQLIQFISSHRRRRCQRTKTNVSNFHFDLHFNDEMYNLLDWIWSISTN